MNAGSFTLLSRLISMGSSSLLQYVSESSPWSADPAHSALGTVLALAKEERDAVAQITRHLQKRHVRLPKFGSYPSHYTNINFVSLEYLLPKLVAEQEKEIAEIVSRSRSEDEEDDRRIVQHYLEMKRKHLQTLQDLTASNTPAGAA
jgi:hypothetical protein